MPTRYYQGHLSQLSARELADFEKRDTPAKLPPGIADTSEQPEGYIPSKALIDAVNVALILGQPLLLTGEPGTGKTQLAYNLAKELGLGPVLKHDAKSTTTASELFYSFDGIRQFRDARKASAPSDSSYVTLNALGEALMLANEFESVSKLWSSLHPSTKFSGPKRSVVLIDEIDKAPRDTPNDLLNEIERMSFAIPELRQVVKANPAFRPILILTSNSEKNLPAPFLRRCVYYDIPFPGEDDLRKIVQNRVPRIDETEGRLVSEVLSLLEAMRNPVRGLAKRPGTAELINWLQFLTHTGGLSDSDSLSKHPELLEQSLAALVKTKEDRAIAVKIANDWREGQGAKA